MKALLITAFLVTLSFGQSLFISEYIEGSSNNKALEIYNPTGSTVNLAGYELWRIANGGTWDEGEGNAVDLSSYGPISVGDVFVICNSSIAEEYSSTCDVTGTDITYYNGDDAIGLAYNGNLIDAVGEEGSDPGIGWAVAGVENATKEHTLVRKLSVTDGNTNWGSSAGTNMGNSEWVVFDQDTFDYLGSHGELPEIEGCMDEAAANYDPNASIPCDPDCCQYSSAITIHDIQYSNDIGSGEYDCYPSPYGTFGNEQYVTTSGFITAVKSGSNPNFYIQDSNFDTYAGVYVYDNTQNPVLGDEVTFTALVTEYYGLTELQDVEDYTVLSSGNNTITYKNISTGDLANGCTDTGESLEGMLVRVSNVTVTQGVIDEYLEWYVDDESGECQIDDSMFDGQWPEPAVGQQYDNITGVVDYGFGKFGILPRTMIDINQNDDQPVADAGDDQGVAPGSMVTLDGSGSYDPNGTITDYEWTQISGTAVTLSNEEDPVTTFTATNDEEDLIFRLTVYDNDGNDATDEVAISIAGFTSICDIQYTETQGTYCYDTDLEGDIIITSGIVTAIQPGFYPNFYLQDPSGEPWCGIFVYNTSIDPALGDEIELSATVDEDYSFTQLIDVTSHTTVSSGNSENPIFIDTGDLGIECSFSGESYEGMLVKISNIEVAAIDEYGNATVNDGSGATIVDDYFFVGDWPVEVGISFGCITGVVEYIYSEFKILPRNNEDFGMGEECGDESCTNDIGDVNEDGTIDVLDILQVANHILGTSLSGCGLEGADVSGDEEISILDIIGIVNIILGDNRK